MDNFTHSLVGWALGQTGLKTRSRKGLAALVLGANMPDIDVFFGWAPWAPLATHRGFTHGLTGGVALMPPLLAGLLWLLDRWQVRRGAVFRSGLAMNLPWLIALSYIGALTHPLLDMQNTYAVQLFAPFSTRWYHVDTLFIIDVWLWSGLSFAIWLSRRRESGGGSWRKPAILALVGLCAYLGLNGVISLEARHKLLDLGPYRTRPDVLFAGEEPVLFWRRALVWRQDGRIGRAISPAPGLPLSTPTPTVPDQTDDPLVRQAMHASALVSFLRWSILPMGQVQREGCVAHVTLSDARFGNPEPSSRLLRMVDVPLESPACR